MDNQIRQIFAKTFNLNISDIKDDMVPDDIALWDSLGHLNLISSLEENFKIELEFEEMFEIVSFKSIIDIIDRKLNGK